MEARAKIPPTLPRFNPTQSYWQTPPSHLATYRSAETLPESADYVIIGSGITGTMCAWNLLDKLGHGREQGDDDGKPSVVMLEAREVCSGATGRNGMLYSQIFVIHDCPGIYLVYTMSHVITSSVVLTSTQVVIQNTHPIATSQPMHSSWASKKQPR